MLLIKELTGESKELFLSLKIKDNVVIHGWSLPSMRCQWLIALELELMFNFLFNKWLTATPPVIPADPTELKTHTLTSKSSVSPLRKSIHTPADRKPVNSTLA